MFQCIYWWNVSVVLFVTASNVGRALAEERVLAIEGVRDVSTTSPVETSTPYLVRWRQKYIWNPGLATDSLTNGIGRSE
jgi:hypothetical protein